MAPRLRFPELIARALAIKCGPRDRIVKAYRADGQVDSLPEFEVDLIEIRSDSKEHLPFFNRCFMIQPPPGC